MCANCRHVCGNNIYAAKKKRKKSTRIITDGISIEYNRCQWKSISRKQAMTLSALYLYTRIHTERSAIRLNVVVTSVAATDAAAAVISHCSNEDQLFAFNCALIQTHTHSFPLSATYSKWFSLFLYDKSKQGCSSVHQHWH